MSFFVRAAVEALKAFPQVNAEIDGEDVVFKHYYDIGVAVSGNRGLVVPVLRDADTLSMAEIEKQIAELRQKARRTTSSPWRSCRAAPSPSPTAASSARCCPRPSSTRRRPASSGCTTSSSARWRGTGRSSSGPMMYLALSYDHRLIDGREAVQFLVRIKECIEDPERLLLEV